MHHIPLPPMKSMLFSSLPIKGNNREHASYIVSCPAGLTCHCDQRPGFHTECHAPPHECTHPDATTTCFTVTGIREGKEQVLSGCVDKTLNPHWEELCNGTLNTPEYIFRCCDEDNCNADWHAQDLAAAVAEVFGIGPPESSRTIDVMSTFSEYISSTPPSLPSPTPTPPRPPCNERFERQGMECIITGKYYLHG